MNKLNITICQNPLKMSSRDTILSETSKFVRARGSALHRTSTSAVYTEVHDGVFIRIKNSNGVSYSSYECPNVNKVSELPKWIEKLRKDGENLKAVLIGGWTASNNPVAKASGFLQSNVSKIFEEYGVPFAMICGKNADNKPVVVRCIKDDIFIGGEAVDKILPESSPEQIIEDLESSFDVVDIPEKDFDINIETIEAQEPKIKHQISAKSDKRFVKK